MIKTLLILGASAAVYAGPPCKAFEIDIDQQRFTSPTLDFEEIGLHITKKTDQGFIGYLTEFGEEKVPFLHLPARHLHLHDPVGQIWNRWDPINQEWYQDPAVVIRCAAVALGASVAVYAGPPCRAFEIDIDQHRFTSPTLDFEEIGLRITKKDHGFVGYLTDFGEEKVPFLHLPARRLHLHDPVGQRDLIWNRWDSINREWYRDPAVVIRCAPGLL